MTSIRDFVPLSKLGEGSFSTVYKVKRQSDQKVYALKKIKMNNLTTKQKENSLNEIRILASLESQYIVGYKQAFFDQKLNLLCVVMQYADGGDLQKIITEHKKNLKFIPQHEIWKACNHILNGLVILHDKGILHRDLKSANIFLQQSKYKLGDLNVSKVNGGKLAYTQTGTPYYASPQIWRDEPYDSKSDIWSFGCILYELITLKPPFDGKNMQDLFKNIQNRNYSPIPPQYSKDLQQLIKICLQKNSRNRKSAIQILQYPIFQKYFYKTDTQVDCYDEIQQQTNKLLKTIKLPNDLKSLKNNLPSSKYQLQSNKSKFIICDKLKQKQQFSRQFQHYKSDRPMFSRLNTDINNNYPINDVGQGLKSEVYKSPSSKKIQTRNLLKSPMGLKTPPASSQLKLKNSILQIPSYISDRKVYKQQKKSIFKIQNNQSSILDRYLISNSQKKRPVTSMPRTQKQNIIANNSIIPSKQYLIDIKKKLLKKARVLSNNNYIRPSWWG